MASHDRTSDSTRTLSPEEGRKRWESTPFQDRRKLPVEECPRKRASTISGLFRQIIEDRSWTFGAAMKIYNYYFSHANLVCKPVGRLSSPLRENFGCCLTCPPSCV